MSPRRVDESMSLINDMMRQPVDPSYATAAARRVARGLPRSTSTRTILVFMTLALIGFLFALAALNLRSATSVVGQARAELLDAIETRQAQGDQLAAQAAALEREVAAAQSAALGNPGQSVLDQVAALSVATGGVAVSGPGVELTLDDAEDATGDNANPRGQGGFGSGRVTAQDLQLVTNGLWQAGAEAIAINGQRLTSRSAIRFAGEAILVDFRPLARPYVISAVGDPAGLRSRFMASSHRQLLHGAGRQLQDPHGAGHPGLDDPSRPSQPSAAVRRNRPLRHTLDGQPIRACHTHRDPSDDEPHPPPYGDPAMIPAFGLLAGLVIGLLLNPGVPLWLQPYLPIAVIAALDAVFGGLRAVLDGNFNDKVFVVSFLSNVLVAALIVFLGDQLGVGSQLSTGVVVVLGVRIFSNVAAIRRHLFRA